MAESLKCVTLRRRNRVNARYHGNIKLCTTAPVNDHVGQCSIDDVTTFVKVQHGDWRHLGRCTTRSTRQTLMSVSRLLGDVRVRVEG